MISDLFNAVHNTAWAGIVFLLPIGYIGAWRWSVWGFKKLVGLSYMPQPRNGYTAAVSIVTPVYNEIPEVLRAALDSWAKNNPDEIIGVVDYSDEASIRVFREFAATFPRARMIVTHTPGKRAALRDGFLASTGDIVCFIDSDTIWKDTDMLPDMLAPFADPEVGAVATEQRVLKGDTIARKMFDMQLYERYTLEYRFLAATTNATTCVSGRTAVYRRSALEPVIDGLIRETFAGNLCISGDDKCLTRMTMEGKWKIRYQESAKVYTPAAPDVATFIKQQTRWNRNSWRSDFKTVGNLSLWRREPVLQLYLLDRFLDPFVCVLSPMFAIIAVLQGQFAALSMLLFWWMLSRTEKLVGYLERHPADVIYIPLFVYFQFRLALVHLYALYSINTQGWITRWDAKRSGLSLRRLTYWLPHAGVAATILLMFGMTYLIVLGKQA